MSKSAEAPLRIVHLNSMLTGGGTDDQCVKLAHGLCQLGQQVWLAGPAGREYAKVAAELRVPLHVTPPEGLGKCRFILSSAALIRRERAQIVHGHHGRDLWPSVLAARLSGCRPKLVLTRHLAKSPSSWVSRNFLLNRCDALIAVSQFVAHVLRDGEYEPDSPEAERRSRPPLQGDYSRIHVIHGGIDTNRFHIFDSSTQRKEWGLSPEHFAFGVVGGYDLPRGKGQREFLKAAAQVHREIPQARFIIVGRGNMKEILEQDISDLGLREKAWLTPYCRDMPAAMNALNCLVHPQVGTEAFPGVVLEAFACGRPVIASRLDGIPEAFAVTHWGELVQPESVPQLGAAMLKMAREPHLDSVGRAKIHDKVAAGFSLEVPVRQTLTLYRRLVGVPV